MRCREIVEYMRDAGYRVSSGAGYNVDSIPADAAASCLQRQWYREQFRDGAPNVNQTCEADLIFERVP